MKYGESSPQETNFMFYVGDRDDELKLARLEVEAGENDAELIFTGLREDPYPGYIVFFAYKGTYTVDQGINGDEKAMLIITTKNPEHAGAKTKTRVYVEQVQFIYPPDAFKSIELKQMGIEE